MLVLGGGGYTLRNVARCWCYETGRLMGVDLPDNIPESALNEYNYYLDTQRLRIAVRVGYLYIWGGRVYAERVQLLPQHAAPAHRDACYICDV